MKKITAPLNSLDKQLNAFEQQPDAWKAYMQTAGEATEQAREQLRTVTTERDKARPVVHALQTPAETFEGTPREVNADITRLSGDILVINLHRIMWDRDRQEVWVCAWFAVCCVMRTMVRTERDRADRMVVQSDQHMDYIVACGEVEALMDTLAFKEYQDDCPLQFLRSTVIVLMHERGTFRLMLYRDPSEDLPTFVQPVGSVATDGTNGGDNGDEGDDGDDGDEDSSSAVEDVSRFHRFPKL